MNLTSLTFKDAAAIIRPDQSVQFPSDDSFQVFEQTGELYRTETFLHELTSTFLQQVNKEDGFLLTHTDHQFEEMMFYKLYYYLHDNRDIAVFISAYIDEELKKMRYFIDAYQKINDHFHYFFLDVNEKKEAEQFAKELEKLLMNEPCYRLRYLTGDLQSK